MPRLQHWDYKAPFFYMVTLKCLPGLPPLSVLDASTKWGVQEGNPITECIRQTIETFLERTPSVEKIFPYAIMPDHLHMLLKIANIPERKSLMDLVDLLRRLIRNAYQKQTRLNTPLWEERWHDLIVKKQNQLPNFHYYILNNPQMALLRRENREHFHCYRAYHHWRLEADTLDLVGNLEILNEPAFLSVRISRSVTLGSASWAQQERLFQAWRPGATAIGTWWSPAEKMAALHILKNEGNLIFLSPSGFHDLWHPAGKTALEQCAKGRVLYGSPYPPQEAELTNAEKRIRCLALNELAVRMANATL